MISFVCCYTNTKSYFLDSAFETSFQKCMKSETALTIIIKLYQSERTNQPNFANIGVSVCVSMGRSLDVSNGFSVFRNASQELTESIRSSAPNQTR